MKKTTLSLILMFSVLSAGNNILTKEEINILSEGDVNYCKFVNKFVLEKKKNDFGRIIEKKEAAWMNIALKKITSLKSFEKRKKEFIKLVAFSVYRNAKSYELLMEKIHKKYMYSGNTKNFGTVLFISGLKAFLNSSLGYGDIPIFDITVANYASRNLKIMGKVTYTKLGILLAKQLYLQAEDKKDFVDRLTLIYSYILTNAFNGKTIVYIIKSLPMRYAFYPNKIKKAFGSFWDNSNLAEINIDTILGLLVKNANNPKINKLIYHLVKGDAISFMLKDKKVLKDYKFMKKIYLDYESSHEC